MISLKARKQAQVHRQYTKGNSKMKRTEKQKLLKAQDSKKIKKHIHRKRGSQRGPLI